MTPSHRTACALIAGLMLAGCATPPEVTRATPPDVTRPSEAERFSFTAPARFNHTFEGNLEIIQVPADQVAGECAYHWFTSGPQAMLESEQMILGCATPMDGACIVVAIDAPYYFEGLYGPLVAYPDDVIAHEIAHCNGWSHLHEH